MQIPVDWYENTSQAVIKSQDTTILHATDGFPRVCSQLMNIIPFPCLLCVFRAPIRMLAQPALLTHRIIKAQDDGTQQDN